MTSISNDDTALAPSMAAATSITSVNTGHPSGKVFLEIHYYKNAMQVLIRYEI